MKLVISILVIVGVLLGGYKLWEYYDRISRQKQEQEQRANETKSFDATSLPGMPGLLEASLQKAQHDGAKALRGWLEDNRHNIKDPRLAWIELDYVLLLSKTDPLEAKKQFAKVKKRITPDSPVFKRVKDLEKTYE